MSRIYFLAIVGCLFAFLTRASHFRGGTITWNPICNNVTNGSIVSIIITQTYSWTRSQIGCNSSMVATQWPPINLAGRSGTGEELMCSASCSTAGGYVGNEVPITGYCTDYSAVLDLTVSQRSDIVNLTSGAHFTVTFATGGGWQSLALGSSTGWSLSSLIDLRVRSDNGLINTPPVATCISYISIPVNVQQKIQIPVLDAENDFVRCRFANGSGECASTCPPGSLPSGTTLSSSCVLTITGPTINAYYLVAMQVEDFITNTSATPLSSIPLQFLIYVYGPQNCTLKPLLISDLTSGGCQGAQVGKNFTMTLTAMNRCGSGRNISDIGTLSFPIVIKSPLIKNPTNASLWSMTITWTPTVDQVGSQVFCAVAEDSASVQSDQYCVTIFVALSSVPLCPGVTTTSTTTTTTRTTTVSNASNTSPSMTIVTTRITSVFDSTDMLVAFTSQQQAQTSTEVIATMDITTSSIVQTNSSTTFVSSSLSSSTAKPSSAISWLLVVGISLAALTLLTCASICYYYYRLKASVAHRRRQRQTKSIEENLRWRQYSRSRYQRVVRQVGPDQRTGSILSGRYSGTFSGVNTMKISQREKTLLDNPANVTCRQSLENNKPERWSQSKSSTSVQNIDRRTEISQLLTLEMKPATRQNSNESATNVRRRSVNVTRIPLFSKSSIEPERPPSTLSARNQPTKTSPKNLTPKQSGSSIVAVTRAKRASSVDHIKRHPTASTNVDLSRVTFIKIK